MGVTVLIVGYVPATHECRLWLECLAGVTGMAAELHVYRGRKINLRVRSAAQPNRVRLRSK